MALGEIKKIAEAITDLMINQIPKVMYRWGIEKNGDYYLEDYFHADGFLPFNINRWNRRYPGIWGWDNPYDAIISYLSEDKLHPIQDDVMMFILITEHISSHGIAWIWATKGYVDNIIPMEEFMDMVKFYEFYPYHKPKEVIKNE